MLKSRVILAFAFDNFEMLDLYGPAEMFTLANDHASYVEKNQVAYEVLLVSKQGKKVVKLSNSNLYVHANHDFVSALDLARRSKIPVDLFIPGGRGTRNEVLDDAVIQFIHEISKYVKRIITVCTGTSLLAKTGLLDGLPATTNKISWDFPVSQGPNVIWQKNARFVHAVKANTDLEFFTSSGISAGIDLALHIIKIDHGEREASRISQRAEYLWNRDGNFDPFARL